MDIYYKEEKAYFRDLEDFDIEDTLECGQYFQFQRIGNKHYVVSAYGKVIEVQQTEKELIIDSTSPKEVEKIWIPFFDLRRKYDDIKMKLKNEDFIMKNAIEYKPGIRILKQDFFECLISFIISQNKQIPHIKQVMKNLSERFGQKKYINNKEYFVFPTLEDLSQCTEEDFLSCKAGFRAKYLVDACEKLVSKEVDIDLLKNASFEEAKKELLKIKGVGNKVSDCVLLYGLARYEAFPTDVWIKRVMEYFYFQNKETKIEVIKQFAEEKFQDLAGFAQQYLFYYARSLKIGK